MSRHAMMSERSWLKADAFKVWTAADLAGLGGIEPPGTIAPGGATAIEYTTFFL